MSSSQTVKFVPLSFMLIGLIQAASAVAELTSPFRFFFFFFPLRETSHAIQAVYSSSEDYRRTEMMYDF